MQLKSKQTKRKDWALSRSVPDPALRAAALAQEMPRAAVAVGPCLWKQPALIFTQINGENGVVHCELLQQYTNQQMFLAILSNTSLYKLYLLFYKRITK